MDENAAVFWDRQTTESAELLRAVAQEFNDSRPGLPIKVERAGGYEDIFRKVIAGIRAGVLPAMAVSYEGMTSEYIAADAVVALDSLIADPELGLDQGALDDYFPAVLETNRFVEHGGSMYSFPLAKSVLMLYFNKRLLAEAGISQPPETWEDFLAQCRAVKAASGKYAHAVSADCSTLNGIVYSMGGDIVRGRETLYDNEAALAALSLYETLAKEELAYLIPPGSFEDNVALSKNEIAFVLRTSSVMRDMMLLMEQDGSRWGIARIPQRDPAHPATVLYGPNVCLFNVAEGQTRTAWAFVKHFTSPEITARWAIETGYLPVRKSALQRPEMQRFLTQWPYNRAAYDCLDLAKPEPNLHGWQQVRDLAAKAVTDVMTGMSDAKTASEELKRNADRALAQAAAAAR